MSGGALIQPPPVPLLHPGYVSGRWYWPIGSSIGAGTALAANTIRLGLIRIPANITISDLAAKITTLSGGGNIQLAIYAADPSTRYPTGNALAATGNISTGATGVVSGDISGADVRLTAGFYWIAINSDNAVVVLNSISQVIAGITMYIGTATLGNLSGASNSAAMSFTFAQTYGTWPDLTAASLTEAAATNEPLIGFKVSGVG